ncbi:MAG: 16S rRNA (adenine(1518)-N(6)/adenine(1519)-N(6))-dimethyltransferase RsmA, partial [Chloroflexota bacterium]|nr:16S rRNA (adenine(1518)-N(6)/adenine(1519)-N(6))-dimethyltransferase RsmA [Chloroflexota bacterium]
MLQTTQTLDRTTVRALLSKYNLHPKRGLGQNFLVDSEVLRSIAEAAELRPSDAVLEIGPGLGVLTKELLQRARCVLAVELDDALAEVLREELRDIQGLEVLQADILKIAHE